MRTNGLFSKLNRGTTFLLVALFAASAAVHAMDYRVVRRFIPGPTSGREPTSALTQGSDGSFYGTTAGGGSADAGTIFNVTTAGVYTELYSFTGGTDGSQPGSPLVQASDGALYGAINNGGFLGVGAIYKITTGGVFSLVYSFGSFADDGSGPQGGLVLGSDGVTLYGITLSGGPSNHGTVFSILTNGTAYTQLYSFANGSDGFYPAGGLVKASDDTLYGVTLLGGSAEWPGYGTVFKLATNGTFTVLHCFTENSNDYLQQSTPLVLSSDGSMLYGVTPLGGTAGGGGTIFSLDTTDGSTFSVLQSFAVDAGSDIGMVLATNGTLYGVTHTLGNYSAGSVFTINTDGSGYAPLYSFQTTGGAGYDPAGALIQATDGALYGTTLLSGNGEGTVFKITTAGTYSLLCNIGASVDGMSPRAALIQARDGAFYGTTLGGGSGNLGTVFTINAAGSGYNVLYNLQDSGGDGWSISGLIQGSGSDDALYGTTSRGGNGGNGTVFKITTAGVYTQLYSFGSFGGDGLVPYGGLVLGSDGALYGVTSGGGSGNVGTVFTIHTDGSGYASLYSFQATGGDGQQPYGGLVQAGDGVLYGTTLLGGSGGLGTVFKITTAGVYSQLYSFLGGSDGKMPVGTLVQANDGMLYGTTYMGGTAGQGTIFKITTGGAYSQLYSFLSGSDGEAPFTGLVQASDGALYGTASQGGSGGNGAVFKITTAGAYSQLYSFLGGSDGQAPMAGLVQSSAGALYGMTSAGGITVDGNSAGTIFAISVPPTITFPDLNNTYGDLDFAPDASSNSPGTLTFSSSNPAVVTIVGGNIHIVNAGAATITASQTPDGSGNYDAATRAATLTVAPISLTVTANAQNKTAGAADPALTYQITSGALAGADMLSGALTRAAGESAGAYVILRGTLTAGPNYNLTFVSADLTITSATQNQTITFGVLPAKTYGGGDFAPGGTASSGLVVSYADSDPTVATIVSGNIRIVGVGSCTITASQAGDANYNAAADVQQTLTVNKASQTITFNSLPTLTVGSADVALSAVASSDLTASYTSSDATVATIVNGNVHIVGVGSCTIIAAQAGNANYAAATSVPQTLVVAATGGGTPPQITSTAAATPNPALTGQTVSFTVAAVDAASYAWDFGDGTTASGSSVQHTYANPGTYAVIVTVTNQAGSQTTGNAVQVATATTLCSNNNGFPDWVEQAFGVNPQTTAATPFGLPSPTNVSGIAIKVFRLNTAGTGTLYVQALLPTTDTFTASQAMLLFAAGPQGYNRKLNQNGASTGNGSFKVGWTRLHPGARPAVFTVVLRKGANAVMSAAGTLPVGQTAQLPVAVVVSGRLYQTTITVTSKRKGVMELNGQQP